MAERSKRSRKVNVSETTTLASDVYDALARDDDLPSGFAKLTPMQYVAVVEGVCRRVELNARNGPRQYSARVAEAILKPARHKPNANTVPEAYGTAIALARQVNPDTGLAGPLMSDALHALPPGAAAVSELHAKIGQADWRMVAALADLWEHASLERRPTSAASSAFARLLALYLKSAHDTPARRSSDLPSDAILALASSVAAIRVQDLHGSTDPLLIALRPGLEALVTPSGQTEKTTDTAASLQSPRSDAHSPGREAGSDALEAVHRAIALLQGASGELVRHAESGARLEALSAETRRLSDELTTLRNESGDLRAANTRLNEILQAKNVELEGFAARLARAEREGDEWKTEARREAVRAAAHARHEIATVHEELRRILERYGQPAAEIIREPGLDPDRAERLRVNLSNLMQKLDKLANRLREETITGALSAGPEDHGP
jgi:hypothetical protein